MTYSPQHGQPEPQEPAYAQHVPAYAQQAPHAAYPAQGHFSAPPQAPAYAAPPPQQPHGAPLSTATAEALAPGVGGVIGFTVLFGVWAAFSANNRAKKAKALGLPGGKYWGAYFGTLAVQTVLSIGMIVLIMVAMSSSDSSSASGGVTAQSLQKSIVADGDFKNSVSGEKGTPTSALCTPLTVESDGSGTYRCMVDFADKTRTSYQVTASSDGTWVTDSGS